MILTVRMWMDRLFLWTTVGRREISLEGLSIPGLAGFAKELVPFCAASAPERDISTNFKERCGKEAVTSMLNIVELLSSGLCTYRLNTPSFKIL